MRVVQFKCSDKFQQEMSPILAFCEELRHYALVTKYLRGIVQFAREPIV